MIIQQKYIRSLNKHLGQLMQGVDLVIGVPITQENNELVSRIGFSVPTEVGDTVLPSPSFGRIATYNAEGKQVVRRDLPKETAYRQIEWHWNEWRGYNETEEMTAIVDVPYERYPRDFVPPPGVELSIGGSKKSGLYVVSPTTKYKAANHETIIHTINLFLEIFGMAHVLTEGFEAVKIPSIRRLNWTVLPEGEYPLDKLKDFVEPVLTAASEGKRPVIQNRFVTISKYSPKFVAIGRAGFSGYLIFGFPKKNIYVCESAYYGNATYVFDKNWDQLSRLTKAEILDEALHEDRLIHREGWDQKVAKLLR